MLIYLLRTFHIVRVMMLKGYHWALQNFGQKLQQSFYPYFYGTGLLKFRYALSTSGSYDGYVLLNWVKQIFPLHHPRGVCFDGQQLMQRLCFITFDVKWVGVAIFTFEIPFVQKYAFWVWLECFFCPLVVLYIENVRKYMTKLIHQHLKQQIASF